MTVPQCWHLVHVFDHGKCRNALCTQWLGKDSCTLSGTYKTYVDLSENLPTSEGLYGYLRHEVARYAILGSGPQFLPSSPWFHMEIATGAQIGELQLVQIDDPKARHRLLQRFLLHETSWNCLRIRILCWWFAVCKWMDTTFHIQMPVIDIYKNHWLIISISTLSYVHWLFDLGHPSIKSMGDWLRVNLQLSHVLHVAISHQTRLSSCGPRALWTVEMWMCLKHVLPDGFCLKKVGLMLCIYRILQV